MSRQGAFIVTGAGSGIGRALSTEIIRHGHHVFGLGRNPRKLETVEQELGSAHFSSSAVDLSRPDEVSSLIPRIHQWLQSSGRPLLGVVNNAGVFDRLSFLESSDTIWQRQFENNLLSAVRLTRDLFDLLKSSSPSSVLNISSTLGRRPVANTLAYSAIKAAMINWTQGLALEWAPHGIRANCICPGIIDTPIHSFHGQAEDAKGRQLAHASHPLGRMGRAEDVAKAAWFMLSQDAEWTTGSVLNVDGGISL